MTYKRFIGANNGSWSTSTNWSPSGVPTTNDEAVFENSLTVGGGGNNCLDLIVLNGVNLVLNFSGNNLSISRSFLNGGTVRASSGCNIIFSGTTYDAEIYSPGAVYGCYMLWSKGTRTITSTSDLNLYSDTTGAGNWTSGYGRITWNNGNWQMNGYSIQVRNFLTGTIGTGSRNWWMNGNLTCRASTAISENSITIGTSTNFNETTGRVILDTVGAGTYKVSAPVCNSYSTSLNWTYQGVGGTNTNAVSAAIHYKNLIINGVNMNAVTWHVHDSLNVINSSQGAVSLTTLNFYANGGTATFNCSPAFATINFIQNSGSGSTFDIQRCQGTTNNLNQNSVTYILNHSVGTGQTFNCNSTSSTYYIKITGTAAATINCNGSSSSYYLGWGGNAFSQTCGAYTINCATAGSNCSYYLDNITDNTGSASTVTLGASGTNGSFFINGGTNIAGTLNFNGGTLNVNGNTPVVGTFNSGVASNTVARTINWNGRYIRINNQARTANAHGSGAVNISASTTTTISSDMTSSDTSNGGIQMESTGSITMGLWTSNSSPRVKLVAFGTTVSARSWSGNNYIRSIDIEGPVSTSGNAVRFINTTARITWNEIGTAADFRTFYPFLASATGGSFTYGNNSSSTNNQYRIGALLVDNTLAGDNQTWDINKAHIGTLIIEKVNGTWNLNDIIVTGTAQCRPDGANTSTVVFNWNKVIKPATTSGFVGYTSSDDFVLAGGTNCTHNIASTGVDIKGNRLNCASSTAPANNGPIVNINATVAGTGPILVSSNSRVRINNPLTFSIINIRPGFSSGSLEINSDITITDSLISDAGSGTVAKLVATNRTITFTGNVTSPILIYHPLGAGSDITGSNFVITNPDGADRIVRLGNSGNTWATITNGCNFTHSGSGDGTGWLEIRSAFDSGGSSPTIGTLTSQNNNASRGFKFVATTDPAAKYTLNNVDGISGTSTNINYIQGNAYATYNPVLSWLVVKNSNVSTVNSTNWLANDSIYYGTNSGWTITAPSTYPAHIGFFRFY